MYIGIIVGVSIAVLLLFISIMICIIFKRRYKNRPSQHRRNRRTRHMASLQSSSDHHPLTVETSMMHSYESPTRGHPYTQSNGHCVVDMNSSSMNPSVAIEMNGGHIRPLRSLGSPLQLSLKGTSAQDSGIGGNCEEDHRSSQDLDEYDCEELEETERLMSSSNPSINSTTSSTNTPHTRWSCEMANSNILPIKSSRTHKDSECDSLLTDTHSASSSSNNKPGTTSSIYSSSDKPLNQAYHQRQQENSATNSDYHSLISEPPDHQSLSIHHNSNDDDELTIMT